MMARPKGSGVRPPAERFWLKVSGAGVDDCWTWQAALDRRGYGRFFIGDGQFTGAHRFAYEHLRHEIPSGLELDHLCRTPACVNPWHLEPVTHAENLRRWSETVTHCPQGHAYQGSNIRLDRRGYRRCRACANRSRPERYLTPRTPDTNRVGSTTPPGRGKTTQMEKNR